MTDPICKCGKSIDDYIDEITIRDDNGIEQTHKTDLQQMNKMGYDLCVDCRNKEVDTMIQKAAAIIGIDLNKLDKL